MSRDNLLAYLALRENDLHTLQNQLAEEGLSSLGRLEANVITHLEKVLEHLGVKENHQEDIHRPHSVDALQLSNERTERVLGKTTHARSTNIMVTLDVSMLDQPEIIEELLLNGNKTNIVEGYIDLKAEHTDKVANPTDSAKFVLAVDSKKNFKSLKIGDKLKFKDTRNKNRVLRVLEVINPTKIRVSSESTCYVGNNSKIVTKSGHSFKVRDVMPRPVQIQVQKGDHLNIYRDCSKLGHAASDTEPAGVATMLPEALNHVEIGDAVFIDDGKIGGIVIDKNEEYVQLEIVTPSINTAKIKEEKGLNFPNTALGLPALTHQDLEDLQFVVQHADTVGLSFVHSPQDLEDLHKALIKLGRPHLAVVAKIETVDAIQNLARIVLAGLNSHSFGIMIARGDLAVEVGFENMSIVQEDILCMCDAAHIPVIWATQVLENLAKLGVPARAEITDSAMGHRAECVMLNKGPHIVEAVRVLSKLLTAEARHHVKKRQVFSEFTKQQGLF